MDFEALLPLLEPILTDEQYVMISEGTSKKERTEILVDVLRNSPESLSVEFCNAIAGLYPESFCTFMDRQPTVDEKGKSIFLKNALQVENIIVITKIILAWLNKLPHFAQVFVYKSFQSGIEVPVFVC